VTILSVDACVSIGLCGRLSNRILGLFYIDRSFVVESLDTEPDNVGY